MTTKKTNSAPGVMQRRIVGPIMILAILLGGCGPNEAILKSKRGTGISNTNETLAPRKTSFERELEEMRDVGFDYIFVVRRKDGQPMTDEDRKFLKDTIPAEVNRRVAADDGKAFIFGSGFAVDAKVLEDWRKRFNVEDLSKPIKVEGNNTNAARNTNK